MNFYVLEDKTLNYKQKYLAPCICLKVIKQLSWYLNSARVDQW